MLISPFFKMFLGTYEREIISVNEGIPVWLFVLCGGGGGGESVACDFLSQVYM